MPSDSLRKHVSGFQSFLLRGNVVDLAVAVVIGAAFTALVNAFVKAFITPLVGLVLGQAGDFSDKTITISDTTFPVGGFIQAVITFAIIAAVVYWFVVLPIQLLMARFSKGTDAAPDAPTKICPECLSGIPEAARRCAFCTSPQTETGASTAPAGT